MSHTTYDDKRLHHFHYIICRYYNVTYNIIIPTDYVMEMVQTFIIDQQQSEWLLNY